MYADTYFADRHSARHSETKPPSNWATHAPADAGSPSVDKRRATSAGRDKSAHSPAQGDSRITDSPNATTRQPADDARQPDSNPRDSSNDTNSITTTTPNPADNHFAGAKRQALRPRLMYKFAKNRPKKAKK
jgi:hypothetical protein